MNSNNIYKYLERIGNLLRAEARQAKTTPPLQPVQLEILHYLSLCNQHSDIPAAVTEYLGLTKGTVSQSLSVLEKKGLIEKKPDTDDRRVIHLSLTEKGRSAVDTTLPPELLKQGLARMSHAQRDQLLSGLESLLKAMQNSRGLRPFGVCGSCYHLHTVEEENVCTLTNLPLSSQELEQVCREHKFEPDTSDQLA